MVKMSDVKRICLWSGPRNISTALMYSFAQRQDTKVFDEPLYAYYLRNHPEAKAYHPGAKEVLNSMENSGKKVVDMMLTNNDAKVLFFKHMTHHLLDLDKSFMRKTINIILTRNPEEMLPSFDKVIPNPTITDVGYALHLELLEYFKKYDISYVILDSKKVLLNPAKVLQSLCKAIGLDFDEAMLKWEPQKRAEDGIWAKYWYTNVHKSSGFIKYQQKKEPFPRHLKPLLNECQPLYEQLIKGAI